MIDLRFDLIQSSMGWWVWRDICRVDCAAEDGIREMASWITIKDIPFSPSPVQLQQQLQLQKPQSEVETDKEVATVTANDLQSLPEFRW